jgi:predicted acyltransferase
MPMSKKPSIGTRVAGLDIARGMAIMAAIVFSLWGSLFSSPPLEILRHNMPGKFTPGDLIFPIFLFCSGVSLWLYLVRLKGREGRIEEAERKYFDLLLFAAFIAIPRFFISFPDEVAIISICGIIALNLAWKGSRTLLAAYAAAVMAILMAWQAYLPNEWNAVSSGYLGGWAAVPYYSIMAVFGVLVAKDAFPKGEFAGTATLRALGIWAVFWLVLASAIASVSPIDKIGLSPSFAAVSIFASLAFLMACIWIADQKGFRNGFASLLGANSIYGWAMILAFFTASVLLQIMGRGTAYACDWPCYLLLCAFVIISLYAALKFGKIGRRFG